MTGDNGLFSRIQELPKELQVIARHPLEGMARRLLQEKKIVKCIAIGSKAMKWLDVPDGSFAKGQGEFSMGSGTSAD